ncbi:AsmA family protein [Uliginosibacterium gangwonense]|uniref:AsmA family protein n=1 Tax=Uliginosibacterium gangwonense TaxID=392736 RepID=UPI0003799D4F|nr:AsmA family protein [Uliginosibacterium gangwonense]
MHLRIATAMRVLGFVLGGFFALSAAIVLFVWASFDASRAGAGMAQYFHDQYQRTLHLGEEPILRMRPFPVLELRKVSLSEPGKSAPFASAERIRIKLQLIPLLLHQTVMQSIAFEKLELNLAHTPDQGWNLADLLAGGEGLQEMPWLVQLDRLDVDNAQLNLEDKATNTKLSLTELGLHTGSLRNAVPGNVQVRGVAHPAGSNEEVKLSIEAHYTLKEQLAAGQLDRLHIQFDGDTLGLKGASCNLDGNGLVWQTGGNKLNLAGASLHLRGALGEQALEFSGDLATLARDGVGLDGKDWKADLVIRKLDRETRLHADIPTLSKTPDGFQAAVFHSSVEHHSGKQSLNFKADGPMNVDFNHGVVSLPVSQGALNLESTLLRGGKANLPLKGKVVWHRAGEKQVNTIELALSLLSGKDALDLAGTLQQVWPPRGQMDVGTAHLDLDRLLTPVGLQDGLANALPALGEASLTGKLNLAQLRARGIRLNTLKGALNLDQGKLALNGLQADLYSGKLSGDLVEELGSGHFDFKGEFEQIALWPLARDLGRRLPLAGEFSGSHTLSGSFKAGQPVTASLQGAVRWKIQNGSIQGLDMARSLREFHTSIRAGKATARSSSVSENMLITAASSRFVFDNGKLVADSIVAGNDWLSLSGSGTADLNSDEIDFSLKTDILPKVATTSARDLIDLRGKPIPIRLKGKSVGPDVRFEPTLQLAASNTRKMLAPVHRVSR